MKSHLVFSILCLLVLGTGGASTANAWWNPQFASRKQITLETTSAGSAIDEQLGTVPVLLRLSDANFRFDLAKQDGSDLRFVADDDKTLLPFHVEKFDPLLHEALVWVRFANVEHSAKSQFWLYYGNEETNLPKGDDAKGTYDERTAIVYHFAEHGQAAFDSSGRGNNSQNAGAPDDAAIIGTGLLLDASHSLTLPADPAWTDGGELTWSAWVKFAAPQANAVLYGRRATGRAFFVGLDNGVFFVQVTDAAGTQRSSSGAPLAAARWTHIALVAAGSRISLYVDGAPYGALAKALPALDTVPLLGGGSFGSGAFIGSLDELEISTAARPAAYVKWSAINQGPDNAGALSFGADEVQSSWLSALKTGYLGIIIGSLTVDGWVVIVILALMSAISWTVMIRKAGYLNSVAKGNTEFLKQWRKSAGDLSFIDGGNPDAVRTLGGRLELGKKKGLLPPLYHIYHIGIEETQLRIAADGPENAKVLSARSIQAIRAVLDGGLVRETQKLNSQMVLLTIAISGGPFLGLLGTVIGVMITFAAVAAAGDVNVNAIAPGIAAALAATVAGLGVAIPALFGYNYLLTRVKAMTSDMHVFIDEFVTRLAEFYSEPNN